MAGVDKAESTRVAPPRVARVGRRWSANCTSDSSGTGPGGANVVIGRIVGIHVDDALFDADGNFDPHRLDTIGRMGGRRLRTHRRPIPLAASPSS